MQKNSLQKASRRTMAATTTSLPLADERFGLLDALARELQLHVLSFLVEFFIVKIAKSWNRPRSSCRTNHIEGAAPRCRHGHEHRRDVTWPWRRQR